jgi:uncharacterized protein (TIGR02453 family)
MSQPHFTPALFDFLRDLARHNDRDWFKANRERYERDVRDPLLRFVRDAGPGLARISPQILADPRPVGGSMFRVHRDTRFSSDKSPYKTHAAAQFRHAWGKDAHAPGYYLHLEPGSVFWAGGVWRPDGASVTRIRAAIVHDPDGWKRIVRSPAFRKRFSLEGESLKRAPRTVPADHPLLEDLRRKDFVFVASDSEEGACAPGFLKRFVADCRAASRFMAFLAEAVGMPW